MLWGETKGETANFKTWGGFKRLQIFTRLPKTSIVKFHEVLKSSEASSSLLKVWSLCYWNLPKSSSPLFPPWRDFIGLHNWSLIYFPLILFRKNRTLLCIQIISTWFGCFEPLEKITSRKNSDVIRTLTKGRKLLHVFSRSVVGEKTPWRNFSPKISVGGKIFDFLEDSAPLILTAGLTHLHI